MQDNKPDLALSRTFRVVGGQLSAADQAEQWAHALSGFAGGKKGSLTAGTVVDAKYRVVSLVGVGGMGTVYRVQHLLLGKEMALKTFSGTNMTADAWQRFQREAQAIAKLTHANIVQVFDFGFGTEQMPYYTMELLVGQSLSEKIQQQGRMAPAEALPVFAAAADALLHAHNLGIVHRDIKPANIFLNQAVGAGARPVVKVVDFGIAKLVTSQGIEQQSQTDLGLVFGSPLYMSPEQSIGSPTDQRTDIYSYGCSLFEALTGKPPFLGKNAFDTISMHCHKKPPSLVDASGGIVFDPALEVFVSRLLAKEIRDRHQSFDHVLADLFRLHSQTTTIAIGGLPPGRGQSPGKTAEGQSQAGSQSQFGSQSLAESQEVTGENRPGSLGETGPIARMRGLLSITGMLCLALLLLALAGAFAFFIAPRLAPKTTRNVIKAEEPAPDNGPAKLTESKPQYFSTVYADGRIFHFLDDTAIGGIKIGKARDLPAIGTIRAPRGERVLFTPNGDMSKRRELFQRFRPDDIQELICTENDLEVWTSDDLDYISKYLTELDRIDFTGQDLNADSIPVIDRFSKLTSLIVSETKLTGEDLLKLKRLLKLHYIEANHLKKMSLFLQKVAAMDLSLNNLEMDGCDLTDKDMIPLSQVTNLLYLSLKHDPISEAGLKKLVSMKHLLRLKITGPKLGPAALETFCQLKTLKNLEFSPQGWSAADRERLKLALPGCDIDDQEEVNPAERMMKD